MVKFILEKLKINEIAGPKMSQIKGYICESFPKFCGFMDKFNPSFSKYINLNAIKREKARVPGNASVKQFAHFAQIMDSGKFQKYDYGKEGNL